MAGKQWYDKNIWLNILWMSSGIIWLPIYIYFKLFPWTLYPEGEGTPKWVRWWGNRVDNLVDQFKEFIHCHNIPYKDYHINISRWMNNRTTFGDLIRPRRDPDGNCWSNCDSEDCPGNECNCPK